MGRNRNKFKQDSRGDTQGQSTGGKEATACKGSRNEKRQDRGGCAGATPTVGGGGTVRQAPSAIERSNKGNGRPCPSVVGESSSSSGAQTQGPPFKLAVQPVKAKYGGMGFAKPSVFVNLHDAEFNDKFEAIFFEHVKGWAGFSYTKARKKQEQGQMLWKQRLLAKQGRPVPQAKAMLAPEKTLTKRQRRKVKAEREILNFRG